MLAATLNWFSEYAIALVVMSAISVLLVLVSVLATPWLVAQLPRDYFSTTAPDRRSTGTFALALSMLGNLVGAVLVLLGVVMLVTPGPGIVALLLGLTLCRFPGKHLLVRRVARQPSVFASLNWLRERKGKAPFEEIP